MERSTRENLNSVGGVVFLFIRARGNIFSWYLGEVRKASAARVGSGVGGAALKSFFFVLKNQQLEIYRFFLGGGEQNNCASLIHCSFCFFSDLFVIHVTFLRIFLICYCVLPPFRFCWPSSGTIRGTQRENISKILEISFSAFLDCFRAF